MQKGLLQHGSMFLAIHLGYINNTSESDPRSYEATKAVAKKAQTLLSCFHQGFIAQLVEHCTRIVEVMGLNPTETSESSADPQLEETMICACPIHLMPKQKVLGNLTFIEQIH